MKMMNNKTSLALAVATALGVMSPLAFAVVKIGSDAATLALPPSSDAAAGGAQNADHTVKGGYVRFAAEQNGETSLALMNHHATAVLSYYDGDLTAAIPVPASYTVDSTKTLSIKVTLTGGAKFANEAYLVCPTSGWQSGAVSGVATNFASAGEASNAIAGKSGLVTTAASGGVPITVANKATATFNITPGLTTNNTGFCLLSFVTATLANQASVTAYTIGTLGDIGISVETTYIQSNNTLKVTTGGVLAKFVTALKSVVDYNVVNVGAVNTKTPSVSIDVRQASKGFAATSDTGGKGAPNTTTIAPLGSVYITSAGITGSTIRLAAVSAGTLYGVGGAGWAQIMTAGSLTIDGPLMQGLKEINLFRGDNVTACATNPSVTLKGTPSITTGGGSVTVSGIPLVDLMGVAPAGTTGVNICATVDGTKVLNAGQLTAVLTGGGVDKFIPDLGAGANITEVKINGARLRVLNIPKVGGTETASLRFYNTSSQDIVVIGTLYGEDGKVLGTENATLFSPLKANDVEQLNAAGLAQKFGITTPWANRAWLLVQAQADVSSFRVMSLIRSANGTLINMSTDVTN